MNPHVEAAARYCRAVIDGTRPANKWERRAVERHMADLARPLSPSWPYVFDEDAAARPCRFIEGLPHIKGALAKVGALLVLEDWQCFIITTVFGWIHHATGFRRFTEVYVEVPRKNAKSTLSSGVALYMLTADGEQGAEIYSAATSKAQARIIFDDAKAMAAKTADLSQYFGVAIYQSVLTVAETSSKFQPLASKGLNLDGLNIHYVAVDELHAHETRTLFDVLDTARGAREQSLLWSITTAGSNRAGICYERRSHVIKVLGRVLDDPSLFGIIYTIDDGDDPFDPASFVKANPNYGVSVLVENMETAARKARDMPSALNNFLTKRLDVWVSGESEWLDMLAWARCGDAGLRLEDFEGEACFMGLDLAEKKDFAALCLCFERAGHWYVFPKLYLNQHAVDQSPNAQLAGWCAEGFVCATPGNVTDYDVIAQDMREACARFEVQEIAFDPALSKYFAAKLVDEGLPMVEIAQRTLFFTPPILQIENMVLENLIHHPANPAFTWHISNVVIKKSKFNELRAPTKERDENKIDGAISMLLAMGRALSNVVPMAEDMITSF